MDGLVSCGGEQTAGVDVEPGAAGPDLVAVAADAGDLGQETARIPVEEAFPVGPGLADAAPGRVVVVGQARAVGTAGPDQLAGPVVAVTGHLAVAGLGDQPLSGVPLVAGAGALARDRPGQLPGPVIGVLGAQPVAHVGRDAPVPVAFDTGLLDETAPVHQACSMVCVSLLGRTGTDDHDR